MQLERAGSKSGRVLERRRAERVDSLLDDPEVDQESARRLGARSGLYVPLLAARPADRRHRRPRPAKAATRASPRPTCGSPRRSRRAPPSRSTSRRASRGDALRRVVEAQELERRRLARELHDQTGQELTSVLLGLKARRGGEDRRGADGGARRACASRSSRRSRTSAGSRSSCARRRSTTSASSPRSSGCARRSRSRPGCASSSRRSIGDRLPTDVETALYRIVQEALTNIVKHAQASSVSIVLARSPRAITAVIEDDGRGFVPDAGTRGSRPARDGRAARAAGRQAEARVEPGRRHDDRRRGSRDAR